MNQPEIIARQQRLLREFSAATAERNQAEKHVEAQHEEAVRDTSTRAEAARSEVQTIHKRTQKLAVDAGRQTRLPAPASVSTEDQRNPLSELRNSVEQATRALDDIDNAVYRLRVFREQRGAARVRIIVVGTGVLLFAMIAFGVWISEQQAQATATAQAQATAEAHAQATATAQVVQAQATATAQVAQPTAEAQAQALSQRLGFLVPSLAFFGLERNTDWTPVIVEFDGVPMALVPADCFVMGSDIGSENARPAHQVCFEEPFWIDVYEVTNEQFQRLGGVAERSSVWEEPQQPRENITWEEAEAFCQQRGARLPTEAEWEYAARGPDALAYPWGNEFISDNVVHRENSDSRTWDVGSKPGGASWVGALDMTGNVWEWVNDWYGEDYSSRLSSVNPQGPKTGANRVHRGGAFGNTADTLDSVYRGRFPPSTRISQVGFRCALSQ